MADGCGAKFAKIMLIIFNIIFLASGLILMALGIWLLVTLGQSYGPGQIFTLAGDAYLYRNSAILLIAMGAFIVVVTVLGLVAAIRESKILLIIYLVLLIVIFCGELAGGIVAIVYKDQLLNSISGVLTESLQFTGSTTYYSDPGVCKSSEEGKLWDYAQVMFQCCGVDSIGASNGGWNGYNLNATQLNSCNMTKTRWPSTIVPLTCCYSNQSISSFNPDNQTNLFSQVDCSKPYTEGCVDKIEYWIVLFAPVLIGIGIGFAMLEMFGIIFVVCLCMHTDKEFSRF